MENRKMVPEIRFSGFTDPWEQRKVGDYVDITTGKLDANAMKEDGKYDFYTSGIQKYKIDVSAFEGPAITIAGNGATVGYMHLADGKFNAYQRTYILTDFQADRHFLFFEIGNKLPKKITQEARTGNIPYIVMDMLTNLQIVIPEKSEQEKIGQYIQQLDNLITLHQRKLEKLKTFKKAMLDKMFPKNGELVPEIRFSGFTDPWEQRKAIDIADYLKGNGYSKGDLTEAGTPIILYGRLYTNYQFAISEVDTFAVPRNGAVYSQGNEVIVPASGETAEDIARASAVEKSGVLLGGDLNILRPFDFMDPLFLALAISNGEPQKELAKKAQGKSVVHIHNSDIQEVTIAYPSRTEQDRIGSVFRLLDHRITLHQRKLEKLQNIKKSMLNKMFI